jgi:hypothetical protein
MNYVEYETDGAVALGTLAKPPHNLIDAALTDGIVTACLPWRFSGAALPAPRARRRFKESITPRFCASRIATTR